VNARAHLFDGSSLQARPLPADEGIGLVLDLMDDEPAEVEPAPGRLLSARVQEWSRRAAGWGAGQQGARRGW
jgi:hypothetical protein